MPKPNFRQTLCKCYNLLHFVEQRVSAGRQIVRLAENCAHVTGLAGSSADGPRMGGGGS